MSEGRQEIEKDLTGMMNKKIKMQVDAIFMKKGAYANANIGKICVNIGINI